MRVHEHTRSMLAWWHEIGIDRADLAVLRPSGAMLWHRDGDTTSLPLAWARAQNVLRAEVYVRPARGYTWSLVFLDDVATPRARAVTQKYDALVVETSPAGGCHIWLACARRLAVATSPTARRFDWTPALAPQPRTETRNRANSVCPSPEPEHTDWART